MKKTILIMVFVMIFLINNVLAYTTITPTADSRWSMDSADIVGVNVSLTDTGLNSNNLIINESVIMGNAGKLGECANFDGTNTAVLFNPTATGLNIRKGNWTISLWVRTAVGQADTGYLFGTTNAHATGVIGSINGADNSINGFIANTFHSVGGVNVDNVWQHIVYRYDGVRFEYWLGGNIILNASETGTPNPSTYITIGNEAKSTVNPHEGDIDEVCVWNELLTVSQIAELWNGGTGTECIKLTAISININSPADGESFNANNFTISFNITESTGTDSNCSVLVDGVVNATINDIANGTNNIEINVTGLTDGTYGWFLDCWSANVSETNTTNRTVYIDFVQPSINVSFPLNGSLHYENFSLDITIEDVNNYEAEVNVTFQNGTRIFSQGYNTSGTTEFNITNEINHTAKGWYNISIEAADGHTLDSIKDIPHTSFDKTLTFIEASEQVKVYPVDKSLFVKAVASKGKDRYSFSFERSKVLRKTSYDDFIVEGGYYIDIIQDSDYPGHLIVKKGSSMRDWYWIDFDNNDDYRTEVYRVSGNKVMVRVYGDSNKDYLFNSLGRLNVNSVNITYYFDGSTIVLEESYEQFILSGFLTELFLNATYNPLRYNISLGIPSAALQWNNTNYTANVLSYNSTEAFFNYSVVPSYDGYSINITHLWYFSIQNITNSTVTVSTDPQNQTLYNILVDVCNATIPYPVLNMTYFDENTGVSINLTNGYALAIYDGTFYYNLTGSFADKYTDSFCTNLPSLNVTYNWDIWGTLTLQKAGYVTRIFTIPDSTPYTVSNNPTYNLSLYLIDLGNSSTVTYTWLTMEFQPIDGTLLIFKCNINGTRSLVESTPIATGQAIANIELITQPYSYEVIIDGITYTDDSFTVCHIEAATAVTYYVDVIAVELMPVIGMFLIDCTIVKLGNTTVRMSWSAHPYITDPVQGCLVAYRQTVTGKIQVYENCTTGSASSITRTIPDNPWDYFVEGYINQSGNVGYCQNSVVFHKDTAANFLFGIMGLVAAVLMIMSLALMYAGEGENSVIAAGVGLVVSWILGVIAFDWLTVSAIIAFLAFIVAIGRYSRK